MLKLSKVAIGVCMVATVSLATASADPTDVALVVKGVQQAYPKLRALCSGGQTLVQSAVNEVMGSVSASLKKDKQAAAEAATQRILAGCPY
ncbi:MAG: hypothetical protein K2W33_18080 [Burkholderiales bacterium]|nr:hypothetical protein [Burkholderiales bacterium]